MPKRLTLKRSMINDEEVTVFRTTHELAPTSTFFDSATVHNLEKTIEVLKEKLAVANSGKYKAELAAKARFSEFTSIDASAKKVLKITSKAPWGMGSAAAQAA